MTTTNLTSDEREQRSRMNAPERLWLQPGQALDPSECTLSHVGSERVNESDVGYVRADIAATSMRDLCVEKVKLMADEWQMLWEKDLTGDHSEKIVYVQAANQIILALESLTLDQVEQKRK